MKALQLVPAMNEGGVERYVVTLNHILTTNGWENTVVSKGGKLIPELEQSGAKCITLDLKSKNPFSVPYRVFRLYQILREERPDVVCAHSRVPAWIFFFANKFLHLKWITLAHGANSISGYSKVMTFGDLTMCPSNFVANYLKNAYGINADKLRVVPHAVDAKKFDPEKLDTSLVESLRTQYELKDKKVIMSIGRITRLKGYDNLIHAFAQLKLDNLRLIIVGSAEPGKESLLAELKRLVGDLSLDKQVIFAGGQSQVAEWLALADVVVSANTLKPESFGLSMVEALAMNKPVVAKAFGGALDIVRDGVDGELVKTDNDFPSAIRKALKRNYTGLRASALERFSFENMVKRTMSVYNELVQ